MNSRNEPEGRNGFSMDANHLGKHLIPIVLALCCGVVSLYWYFKFESRLPGAVAKVEKLQAGLRSLDCPALNKDVVLAIARESVEQDRRFAEVYLLVSLLFLGIAVTSFAFARPASAIRNPAPE